jgi:uncharacterized protein
MRGDSLYPHEYIQYLIYFHGNRDYFECHEVLEEYWKKADPRNKDSIWVGLILLAVSTYHHRRNNFKGAKRTLEKAMHIFISQIPSVTKLGLHAEILQETLAERLKKIETGQAYSSFNLPISDPGLLETCISACKQIGFQWEKESDTTNDSLIHRHKLRDRSDVILERMNSLNMRKGSE